MLPKMRRRRDAWWAAIQQEWHLWTARRLYRQAEAHGRQALKLRDQAAHHEQRAKHFQLQEIRLREGL
jgi:hypothetical protein